MSDIGNAIALGILQGLTEFLPVSSSGHIELAQYFLNDTTVGEQGLLLTIVLHFATALSTMVIFRKEIIHIIMGLFSPKMNEEKQFSLKIILSMIPAVIIGLLFLEKIESLFVQNIPLVAAMLIVTGVLLFMADRAKDTQRKVTYVDALIIGVAQAIAIIPGISRSGATISTSVLLGIDRTRAARFSFLMVIPLIMGKMLQDVLDGDFMAENVDSVVLLSGFVAAFIAGCIACTWMIKLVQMSSLKYFSFYCFAVSIISYILYQS